MSDSAENVIGDLGVAYEKAKKVEELRRKQLLEELRKKQLLEEKHKAQAVVKPKPKPKPTSTELKSITQQLLWYVIAGDQPAAEDLLDKNPNKNLASIEGEVKDHADLIFKGTAFQCAVASLDWFMWKMLLKKDNISPQQALDQLQGIENHPYFQAIITNWKNMLTDYDTYIEKYNDWDYKKREDFWVKQIGKGQHNCPMHVLQELCLLDRPFDPVPNFKKLYLLNRELPDWLEIANLGNAFSIYRGPRCFSAVDRGRKWEKGLYVAGIIATYDRNSLQALLDTRMSQIEELVASLTQKLTHPVPK